MNNSTKYVFMSPKQVCVDDADKALIDVYKSGIDYYDKLINEYKESKRQEKIKLARFVLERINKEDSIEKYRQPGMVVICEDLVFICNHDLKFQYANLEDEI